MHRVVNVIEIILGYLIYILQTCKDNLPYKERNFRNFFEQHQQFYDVPQVPDDLSESDLENYGDIKCSAFVWVLSEDKKRWIPKWANKEVLKSFQKQTLEEFLQTDFSEISDQLLECLQNMMFECYHNFQKINTETLFQYPNGKPEFLNLISVPIKMKSTTSPAILSFYTRTDLNLSPEDSIFLNCCKTYGTQGNSVYDENGNILMRNNVARTRFRKFQTKYKNPIQQHGFTDQEMEYLMKTMKETKRFGEKIFTKDVSTVQNGETVRYAVEVIIIRNANTGEKSMLIIETDITKLSKISTGLINVFHELRVALYGITGVIELLKFKNNSSEIEKLLRIAENSSKVLLSLLNDILEFSRLQSGEEFPIELSPMTPAELFNELDLLVDSFSSLIYKKDLKLYVHYPLFLINQKNLVFDIDYKRIRQILSNFVMNARKFTEKGKIEIHLNVKETELEFKVIDSGKGIPEKKIRTLFQPFVQVSDSDAKEGTGIGLTISKKLIERMDGKVSVKSEVGYGTEFSFIVPLKNPIKIEENTVEKVDKKVLIIDFHLDAKISQLIKVFKLFCSDVVSLGIHSLSNIDFNDYDLVLCDHSIAQYKEISKRLNVKNTLMLLKINEFLEPELDTFTRFTTPVKPYSMYLDLKKRFSKIEDPKSIKQPKLKILYLSQGKMINSISVIKEFGDVEICLDFEDVPDLKAYQFIFFDRTKDMDSILFNNIKTNRNSKIILVVKNELEFHSQRISVFRRGFDDLLVVSKQNIKLMMQKWNMDRDLSHILDSKHVIIADDNKVNRMMMNRLVKKFGACKITLVDSGEELVEKFTNHSIIFSDLEMGGISGAEAAVIIKRKNKNVPFVLVSGRSLNMKILYDSKIDDYILKPIKYNQIQK
eukprot:gene4729-8312_t